MVNQIKSYFHLFSSNSQTKQKEEGAKLPPIFWDIAHFFCLFLGIVSHHFVKAFQSIPRERFNLDIYLIAFSIIVAFAIFPAIFKKTVNTAEPKFIQLCMTFASGLGYQSLFQSLYINGEPLVKKAFGG